MSKAFARSCAPPNRNFYQIIWYLFAGSRGAQKRVKIIDLLRERPLNLNQLSGIMGLDYRCVQHHIAVLEKNNLITKAGEKYGVMYFISDYLEHNMKAFEEIKSKIS